MSRNVEGWPDYSVVLGHVRNGLAEVADCLKGISAHPALQMTPAQHSQAIANAGNGLIREVAAKLDQASQKVQITRGDVARLIGSVRWQKEQRYIVLHAALVVFLVALLMSPFIAAGLSFGLDGRVGRAHHAGRPLDAVMAFDAGYRSPRPEEPF